MIIRKETKHEQQANSKLAVLNLKFNDRIDVDVLTFKLKKDKLQ